MFQLFIEGDLHAIYQTKIAVEKAALRFEREGWTVEIKVAQ